MPRIYKTVIKKCEQCGNSYNGRADIKHQRYCYRQCSGISNINKIQRNCFICGEKFEVQPNVVNKGNGKFCSVKCKNEHTKTLTGELNPLYKKINKNCQICGKEFLSPFGRVSEGNGKFCSKQCYAKHLTTIHGENHPNWKPKIDVNCHNCGKEFEVHHYKTKSGHNLFCSQNCAGAYNFNKMITYNTSIEITVEEILKTLNVNYETQKIIGHFIVDFYLSDYNLIIEADGDYWHNLKKGIDQDKRKNTYFKNHGYNLLRLWEHEINQGVELVIEERLKNIQTAII